MFLEGVLIVDNLSENELLRYNFEMFEVCFFNVGIEVCRVHFA